MSFDPITNPDHYRGTKIDWLQVVGGWNLPPRVANALKYICRYPNKGAPAENLLNGDCSFEMEAEKIERAADADVVVTMEIPRA